MLERSRKDDLERDEDENEIAAGIRRQTEENGESGLSDEDLETLGRILGTPAGRREAARILGSLGGERGGQARAESLSKRRRQQIAKKAAEARWANKGQDSPDEELGSDS